jgi:hypothetical protein
MTRPLDGWYKCRGCGGRIAFFPNGYESDGEKIPPGSVAHSKPFADINTRPVACRLYQSSSTLQLAEIHAGAEPIDAPTDLRPVRG